MGKRRRQNSKKRTSDEHHDNASGEFSKMAEPDQDSDGYFNDEIEEFATKKEKILLDNDSVDSSDESDYLDDDADEVMKLDSDESSLEDVNDDDAEIVHAEDEDKQESEDDEDFLLEEDDVDGDTGLPNQKAWGRKKKEFYDSNLKDADHFENDEEEELVAEEEEKEAMALQQRMALHLDQDDFDFFEPEEEQANDANSVIEEEEETHVVQDLQKLSKEEKIQLLMKESPELFVFLEDYEAKMNEVVKKYHPLLLIARKSNKISDEGRDFIEVMHQLLLNYCLNINFYLWLKAKREHVKEHPVIEKIVQYRNLLSKVEPLVKAVEKEMPLLLSKITESGNTSLAADESPSTSNVKTLAKKANSMRTIISGSKPNAARNTEKATAKKQDNDTVEQDPWEYYNSVANMRKKERDRKKDAYETPMAAQYDENDDDDIEGKRAITYEMAKNKGLIRKRKKENRNPRVKHKMKFRKAIVKRKSQIPTIRNEAVNYGGELTGIKSRVIKSVKIK